MSQYLPVSGFRFVTDDEIAKIAFTTVPDDSETGYAVECDLEYPIELQKSHNDYPPAPEHMTVNEDQFSAFCESMYMKHVMVDKLNGNLQIKIKYIIGI